MPKQDDVQMPEAGFAFKGQQGTREQVGVNKVVKAPGFSLSDKHERGCDWVAQASLRSEGTQVPVADEGG